MGKKNKSSSGKQREDVGTEVPLKDNESVGRPFDFTSTTELEKSLDGEIGGEAFGEDSRPETKPVDIKDVGDPAPPPHGIPPCDEGFRTKLQLKEYDILSEKTYEDLVVSVSNAIKEGWSPQGGVVSTVEFRFLQSMTRVVRV